MPIDVRLLLKHCFVCLQEEIVLVERILLQTLRFDLMVEHPYSHLLRFGKMLRGGWRCDNIYIIYLSWHIDQNLH